MVSKKEFCHGLSDLEIIDRAHEDMKYFACLYERYEERFLRYILSISKLSQEDAQDILQESFIKAWVNLNDFDPELKLSSWLYRIVHNETISLHRKKNSYGKNNIVDIDENTLVVNDYESICDPDNEGGYQITSQILDILPLKYREVLVLKYLERMSYEEISDVLRIPEGTVATRMNRAKKMFKKLALKNKK